MSNEQIFLSYASPDRDRVEPFFDEIERMGFSPWMDSRKLLGGQNWDFEIQRALDKAKIVITFISSNSLDRRGYLQREIKLALKKAEEKLVDDIYLIPVALDDSTRPAELSGLHFISTSSENCLEDLRLSISKQLEEIGDETRVEVRGSGLSYSRRSFVDSYDGLPGYEVRAEYVQLSSSDYPNLGEIADVIRGEISKSVMDARSCMTAPQPEIFNIGQSRWSRTNTLDWVLGEVSTSGRTLSVVYSVHHYAAGAAHPVSGYRSFNYFLSPVTEIKGIHSIFESDSGLEYLQHAARELLVSELANVERSEPDHDWIERGTSQWSDFRNFSISGDSLNLYFGSYQVASYASGHQVVAISTKDLAPFLTDYATATLDLTYWKNRAN